MGKRAVVRDNIGQESEDTVTVNVIPGVRTTVIGEVVDPFGVPLGGIDLATMFRFIDLSYPCTTQPDGTFEITEVTASQGFVRVTASKVVDGALMRATSNLVEPTVDGQSDVGTIELADLGQVPMYAVAIMPPAGTPSWPTYRP